MKVELDEAVEDLSDARKKEPDNDGIVDDVAAEEMAAPVARPTSTPSPEPAEAQLAKADGKQRVKQRGP